MNALDRIVEAARAHPFYRDALRGVGRFEDAPILKKPALYERVERVLRDPSLRRGLYLSLSGGTTTGRPLSFPTAVEENRRQRRLLASRLAASGIFGPGSVVLNLFPCLGLVRSLEIFTDLGERCGATVLPVSAHAENAEAWDVAARFGATMVAGMPARLLDFARCKARSGQVLALESVLFAGEPLHPPKLRMLREVLGARRFDAIYGSAEMGIVAYQAEVCDPPLYRVPRDLLHVEVLEPDGDGFGNLVVTNLVRVTHPLLRFDTGDVGRLVDGTADEALVELRGRQTDSFSIGGNYYHVGDFAPVLGRFVQYQIVLAFEPGAARDRITFRLVGEPTDSADRDRLLSQIRDLLGTEDREFLTDAAFVSPEALDRTPGTQKVPLIVDRR